MVSSWSILREFLLGIVASLRYSQQLSIFNGLLHFNGCYLFLYNTYATLLRSQKFIESRDTPFDEQVLIY